MQLRIWRDLWPAILLAGCGNGGGIDSSDVASQQLALTVQSRSPLATNAQPVLAPTPMQTSAQPALGSKAASQSSVGATRSYWRSRKYADAHNHPTGLREPTAQEMAHNVDARVVVAIRPTPLALERLSEQVAPSGRAPVSSAQVDLKQLRDEAVPLGADLVTETASGTSRLLSASSSTIGSTVLTTAATAGALPASVDNSKLKAFPEIRDQGSIGSCVAFALGYYQYTHELGLLLGWDNKNANNTTKISPKWLYNLANGGEDTGTSTWFVYQILKEHGALTWADFPYVGDTSNPVNYREWAVGAAKWTSALKYKAVDHVWLDSPDTPTGMQQIKGAILNGHVVAFQTNIYSWEYDTLGNDPATSADNALVGQQVVTWQDGFEGAHLVTAVGYDDDVWVDLNDNSRVDSGEKGAFKIANSWGTGYMNSGYVWLAYDALNWETQVSGGPAGPSRAAALSSPTVVTARANYKPNLVGEFTWTATERGNLWLSAGITEADRTAVMTAYYPVAFSRNGGAYGFDGSATGHERTASFAVDLSDLALSYGDLRYQLEVGNESQYLAKLSGFTVVDALKNGQRTATSEPTVTIFSSETKSQGLRYKFQDPTRVPRISIGPSTSLVFGNQVLGTATSQLLSVQNTGTGELFISSLRSTSPLFYTSTITPLRVAPGQSAQLDVQFAPAAAQAETASFSVRSNSATEANAVALTGTGSSNNDNAPIAVYITQQNDPIDNSIAMRVELKSRLAQSIPLSNYQVIYYTNEPNVDPNQLVWDTYYTSGPSPIGVKLRKVFLPKSFGPRKSDTAIQFTFPTGTLLNPNASVIFQGNLHKSDYSWYPDENDDWSRYLRRDGMAECVAVQQISSRQFVFGSPGEALPGTLSLAVGAGPFTDWVKGSFVAQNVTGFTEFRFDFYDASNTQTLAWWMYFSENGPQTFSLDISSIPPGKYTMVLNVNNVPTDLVEFTKQ